MDGFEVLKYVEIPPQLVRASHFLWPYVCTGVWDSTVGLAFDPDKTIIPLADENMH